MLKLEKQLEGLAAGARLVVLATDPMAKVDIPLFCIKNGHAYAQSEDAGVIRFEIVRA